jgi:catechol 2,3-dioxygenase-like lactoylglutathione lyase family enzyme
VLDLFAGSFHGAQRRSILEGSVEGGDFSLEDGSMLKDAPIIPYIPVANVARARRFYEEKLGLRPREEYAGGVIYECGKGSWVFMYPSPGAGTSKASTAFWSVQDVAAEVAALKSRGVVFEEYDMPGIKTENSIASGGGAKTAWFKDSEGNILAISQRV